MERKPKDINQLYREMEEEVARRVRETMELADARRRALAKGGLVTTQKVITISVENVSKNTPEQVAKTSHELIGALDTSLNTVTEHLANKLNENKIANQDQQTVDVQRKLEDTVKVEERANEIIKSVEPPDESQVNFTPYDSIVKDDAVVENPPYSAQMEAGLAALSLAQNATWNTNYEPSDSNFSSRTESLERAPSFEKQTSQIGFEYFEKLPRNNSLDQQPIEPRDFEINQLDLAHGALSLAQHGVRNADVSQEFIDRTRIAEDAQNDSIQDKRRIAEDALTLAQNAATNNTNPFETVTEGGADLRRFGEDALILAENAIKNYAAKNPFETSDDEADINTENAFENQTTNPFDFDGVGTRQMGEDALHIAQNASRSYVQNPFEMEDEDAEDMRQMGADALMIAQTAAKNVEVTKRQLSENAEDIDNVFNSLLDSEDLQKPVVQIGFDQLKETFEKQRSEMNDNILNVRNTSNN